MKELGCIYVGLKDRNNFDAKGIKINKNHINKVDFSEDGKLVIFYKKVNEDEKANESEIEIILNMNEVSYIDFNSTKLISPQFRKEFVYY